MNLQNKFHEYLAVCGVDGFGQTAVGVDLRFIRQIDGLCNVAVQGNNVSQVDLAIQCYVTVISRLGFLDGIALVVHSRNIILCCIGMSSRISCNRHSQCIGRNERAILMENVAKGQRAY